MLFFNSTCKDTHFFRTFAPNNEKNRAIHHIFVHDRHRHGTTQMGNKGRMADYHWRYRLAFHLCTRRKRHCGTAATTDRHAGPTEGRRNQYSTVADPRQGHHYLPFRHRTLGRVSLRQTRKKSRLRRLAVCPGRVSSQGYGTACLGGDHPRRQVEHLWLSAVAQALWQPDSENR